MRILLITMGSHGDVHPFFAIAQALRRAGHKALVLTNGAFGAQAVRAGVALEPLGEGRDLAELMKQADVMHPMRGPRVVLKEMMAPMVPEIFQKTRDVVRGFRADAAVVHPICLGAHWACEQAGVPVATAALAPISYMQSHDRIVFGPWRSHEPRLYATRLDAWFGRHLMRWMLDGTLNKARRELGLSKGRDLLVREFVRPGLNLGLWSPHFRPPAKGDPAGSVLCGFPWFDDHHDHQEADGKLEQFLNDGPAPIVFSLGTAAVHVPGDFYSMATQVCTRMRRRGVLLVGRPEYVQKLGALPASVHAATYVPFREILPRGCLTVHHGGIGTTGQALRAGRPMVVTPLAHDQFDNAARCKRLGVGETLPHAKLSVQGLQTALERVLGGGLRDTGGSGQSMGYAERAAAIGPRIAAEDGAAVAVKALEQWKHQGFGICAGFA